MKLGRAAFCFHNISLSQISISGNGTEGQVLVPTMFVGGMYPVSHRIKIQEPWSI